jgi:hypothetical protein
MKFRSKNKAVVIDMHKAHIHNTLFAGFGFSQTFRTFSLSFSCFYV